MLLIGFCDPAEIALANNKKESVPGSGKRDGRLTLVLAAASRSNSGLREAPTRSAPVVNRTKQRIAFGGQFPSPPVCRRLIHYIKSARGLPEPGCELFLHQPIRSKPSRQRGASGACKMSTQSNYLLLLEQNHVCIRAKITIKLFLETMSSCRDQDYSL